MISANDIKDLVVGTAGDFTGGLLSALLLASKVGKRFQPDEQKVALQAALEEALTAACDLFPEAQKSVTRYYLEQLSQFLKEQVVTAELAKLLNPQPTTVLEKQLLAKKFREITQGYEPEQIPDLDFELFVETLVYAFYTSAKSKPALQAVIQIERLEQLTRQFLTLIELTTEGVAAAQATAEHTAAMSATLYQQAQDTRAIRELLERNLRGIERLPVDYAGGIRNFLAEYTGIAGDKVPFGGRDAEMAQLDTWLLDGHSPPCALMAAEAGRGKSALLVRWTASVTARELAQVAFIPISIRFETASQSAVFGALAARLSELHGEPIAGKQLAMTAEEYRLLCRSLLERPLPEGEHLLLVLDGLDEASDWQPGANLVPLPLPPGVKVLVSARLAGGAADPGGWLRQLNWARPGRAQTFPLQPLSQSGVADVLEQMRNPLAALSGQIDVVGELYRLSDEGDPLLVKLYVEKLAGLARQEPTITPEKLQALEPGLEGYMDDWWRDQHQLWQARGQRPLREKHVTTVLNLLALALGPLSQDDLLALAPPDAGLDSYTLEDALVPLQRFVIGDGRQVHFVFGHPRLRDYFFDRLSAAEKQQWQARFLAYGQKTLEDLAASRTQPEAVAYVVRHYGAHLERAKSAPETFYQLLNQSWAQAWYTLEGTYTGFLNDVARIRSVAAAEKNFPVVVHCALCRASIAALSSNISPNLMAQAIELNLLTARQVLVMISQLSDSSQQTNALAAIAPLLKSDDLYQAALSATRQIGVEWSRARALADLAPHLPEALLPEALSAALQIEDERFRAQVLANLAPHLPKALLPEALSAVRQIGDEEYRAQALAALAPHLPDALRAETVTEALSTAHQIRYEWDRARALAGLSPHLPEALLSEALSVARNIGDKGVRAGTLANLAPHLPKALRIEAVTEALSVARNIGDEGARARVLAAVAPRLPEALRTEAITEALSAARQIGHEGERAEALASLAPHLPEALRTKAVTEALSAARQIGHEGERVRALADLAPRLPQALRTEAVTEALNAARQTGHEGERVRALADLALHLPQALPPEELNAAHQIGHGVSRAWVLVGLASHLPQALLQEALSAARQIGHEGERAEALASLAPHLPKAMRTEVVTEALSAARQIGDEWSRARALVDLAPHLPDALRTEVVTEALNAAHQIEYEWVRAEALAGLAPHLPDALRTEAVTEALSTARQIEHEWYRTRALANLAPHLPDALRTEAITEALSIARQIGAKRYRVQALTALAPHLPQALLPEALDAACQIGNEWHCVQALTALAPHLPQALLPEAFSAARQIGDERSRARALTGLAQYLPEALRTEAVTEALSASHQIGYEQSRVQALAALAPHLPQALLPETLSTVRQIGNERYRAEALAALAPHLPEALCMEAVTEALSAARQIGEERSRAQVLAALAPHLPEALRMEAVTEALNAARQIGGERSRAEALAELAPHLPQALLPEALGAARHIVNKESRAQALAALAPHLTEALLPEALATACQIGNEGSRAQALIGLTPHLAGWARVQPEAACRSWLDTLDHLSTYPRPAFLADMRAFLPFTLALVDETSQPATAAGIWRAIQAVCQWWP